MEQYTPKAFPGMTVIPITPGKENNCGDLDRFPIAMAYVPWQTFENVMEGECALRHGTIFEDLVFPFVGAQAACQADRSQNHSHSGSCGCHNRQPYMQNNSCGRRGVY